MSTAVIALTDTRSTAKPAVVDTPLVAADLLNSVFGTSDLEEIRVGSVDLAVVAQSESVGRSKKWPRIVAGLFFVSVAVGILMNRSLAESAYRELRNLSWSSLVGLFLLLGIVKFLHTTMHWASLPYVAFRRAFQATETYVGASNSGVGGAGLGTGLRVAMLRSWGVSPLDVAVSVVATALAPSFALWGIAGVHTIPLLVTGRASGAERITAVASVCFIVGPAVFWWAALRFPSVLAWVSSAMAAGRGLVIAVIPSRRLAASVIAQFDMPAQAEEMRLRGRSLARARGAIMIMASICAQLALGLLLIGCVEAVSPVPVSLDTLVVLRTFALLRVLSSFIPIPAGLGVLDLGLIGVLTTGGVPRTTAVAAIATYRALTFVLPMFTGSLCAFAWRASQRKRGVSPSPIVSADVLTG